MALTVASGATDQETPIAQEYGTNALHLHRR